MLEKSKHPEMFCAWSSDMYATFVSSGFSYQSNVSAWKKSSLQTVLVLIDCAFYFAFSLYYVEWTSLLHKTSVAIANVEKVLVMLVSLQNMWVFDYALTL